jgi:hypothetical protein
VRADGDDSSVGIAGWGGAVTGIAALSSFGVGAIGGLGIGALNPLSTPWMGIGDGSPGSTQSGKPPSAAPKGSGSGVIPRRGRSGRSGRSGTLYLRPGYWRESQWPGGCIANELWTRSFQSARRISVDEAVRRLGGNLACALGECKSLVDTILAFICQFVTVPGTSLDWFHGRSNEETHDRRI